MSAGLLALGGAAGSVEAKVLNVANNGVDGPACGAPTDPCRSISRAIINAHDGDRIVVGPGRYGDLNGDGIFADVGEESAEVGFGCECMIKIDKSVKLESRLGAAVTVLSAGGANITAVKIVADGVVFGKRNHGFLVTGAGTGVLVTFADRKDVTVAGNVASDNHQGFSIEGSNHTVTDNVASRNFDEAGFGVIGENHTLTQNASHENLYGFVVDGSGHTYLNNVSASNRLRGFEIRGSGHVFRRNTIAGNFGPAANTFSSSITFTQNNIYGNNASGGPTACAVNNLSAGTLVVTNNYWGAASGPGDDPADKVCDSGGGTTTAVPFATDEFKVAVDVW